MRLLIQRVSHAAVYINGEKRSGINEGLLLLVGIEEADGVEDIDFLCKKTINLRIFDDENGVMNRSVMDIKGISWWFHNLHCMRVQKGESPILPSSSKA